MPVRKEKIMKKIDAKGLICPQPIMKMVAAMKSGKDKELEIVVDNETAKENVMRTALGKGWETVSITTEKELFTIQIKQDD